MVEVFKTNVEDPSQASRLLALLADQFTHLRINFDLEDCDKILRVEGEPVSPEQIVELITRQGYRCNLLY